MEKYDLKILYVEDEKNTSIEFYKIFDKMFKTIILSHNGENALKVFESNKDIDLIITDINMPIMDGINLIEKIRELDKEVIIYVVSAYDDKFHTQKDKLEVNQYFSKPTNINDIVEKIKEDFNLN